jgi:hypothetical protein
VSQQHLTPQDGAKFVRYAVLMAWIAGFVCATAIWQVLMDLKLGPGQGHWLPLWVRWALVVFGAAGLTLTAYLMTRAALKALNSRG